MKDKIILITGSSIGIGRETAYKFAMEGARLILTYYKDLEEGEKARKKCLELGAREAILLHLDVKDNQSIHEVKEKITERFGHLHILINNAAVVAWRPLLEQTLDDIEDQVRTNLEGLIKVTRIFLPYVKDAIINIASGAGKEGYEDLTVYCATKFGVRGFTKALPEEAKNIMIYSVNPSMTATRMTGFQGRPPEEVAQIILNTAKGHYDLPSGSDIDVWELF